MPGEFFLTMLKSPAATGALVPSSRYLARAMARAAHGADLLIELGAGTGPVTRALLDALPQVPLIAVELQPKLASRLRQRFPRVDVRQATAKSVVDTLTGAPAHSVLVSSLPFRSLPPPVRGETVASICAFLAAAPSRRLVQFTYQPREPFRVPAGFRWRLSTVVWRNAPPAGVWELRALAPGEAPAPADASAAVPFEACRYTW